LWAADDALAESDIKFQPGLNEELAATACWGTQQAELGGQGAHDGVFALWYGKGPGVDRTGDVFRHGNLAGSSKHGGVLALMGDDHTAESSTNAHQSEFAFVDTLIPIFNPAGVQEIIDYGLHAYALSRFAGTWAAMKCVKDNIESTGFGPCRDGPDQPGDPRVRHAAGRAQYPPHGYRLSSARKTGCTGSSARRRSPTTAPTRSTMSCGAAAASRSSASWRPARTISTCARRCTISASTRRRRTKLGIRLYKVGMPWPLDPDDLIRFADGLHTILVIEEKRGLIEVQIKEELYGISKGRW
jgi:indolepyruvate ferredoxin oxidoreductase